MPPYSDNLYDDSDDESFSAELTPTDGYFNQRDQSQNSMIPDPSIGNSTAESKAREAREESEALAQSTAGNQRSGSSQTQAQSPSPLNIDTDTALPSTSPNSIPLTPASPRTSPRSPQRVNRALFSEVSPFLYPSSPPAYSPSPPSPQGYPNYSTISQNNLEEGRAFLPREPESMGQPADENSERQPLFRRPVVSRTRKFVQKTILVLATLAIITSLLTTALHLPYNHKNNNKDSNPSNPTNPSNPPMDNTPGDSNGPSTNGPFCPSATIALSNSMLKHDFSSVPDLTVIQKTTNNGARGTLVHTVGEISVRRLPENSPYSNGFLSVEVYTSDPDIREVEVNTEDESKVTITSPQSIGKVYPNGGRPCFSIEVIIWAPEGAKLNNFVLNAETLDIKVLPGVTGTVEETQIKTISGKIVFPSRDDLTETKSSGIGLPKMPKKSWWLPDIPYFRPKLPFFDDPVETPEVTQPPNFPQPPPNQIPQHSVEKSLGLFTSRKQYIETTSGTIYGTFSLLDYLHIKSVSGTITADILPQEEDPNSPAPAELYLHTQSSSISAYLFFGDLSEGVKQKIPEREYRTQVESNAGQIQGRYMMGSEAHFKSLSGSLNLEILNAHNKPTSDNHATFSTDSISGTTQVDVITDGNQKEPIHNLSSTHYGKSGSISLSYPSNWEGKIDAKSLSGSLKIAGEGVVIDSDRSRDYVNKEIRAHKGVSKGPLDWSQISVDEISGSVDILIGKRLVDF